MTALAVGLGLAFVAAFASVVLGRNLTRSIFAAVLVLGLLAVVFVATGEGYAALFAVMLAGLALATIQLFGWMLVDVDRDHLPATDRGTWVARSLAFVLLGGGLVLLALALLDEGSLVPTLGTSAPQAPAESMASTAELGRRFFGPWRDLATLCGLTIAAGLVASLMLLRDEGEDG